MIAKQEARGLSIFTDGEYRQLNFQDSFVESVSGFIPKKQTLQFQERRTLGGTILQRWQPDLNNTGAAFTGALFIFIVQCGLCMPNAAAVDKLRIGYGAPSVTMSMLWITKEGKLFEKNGLDVEVLYLESALVQRALIAGNIAFGEMTGSLMAAPKLQGADLVMVAGFLNHLLYRLVARPEIKTVADLRGKRVAVSRFGAGADRATRLLLSKLGLNPEKDVVLLQIGGGPTRIAALLAASIDATILEPPDHKRLQEAGMRCWPTWRK